MNFLEGALDGGGTPAFRAGDIAVPLSRYGFDNGAAPADGVVLGVRPEHIVHGAAAASQPFSKEIEVEIVEPMGSDTLVWGKLGSHNLSFRVEAEKPLQRRRPHSDRLRPGARLAVRRQQRATALSNECICASFRGPRPVGGMAAAKRRRPDVGRDRAAGRRAFGADRGRRSSPILMSAATSSTSAGSPTPTGC